MERLYHSEPSAGRKLNKSTGKRQMFHRNGRRPGPLGPGLLPQAAEKPLARGFGGKDSVKGNRQGSLSRAVKQLLRTF